MDRSAFESALATLKAQCPDHFLIKRITGYSTLSVIYLQKALSSIYLPDAPVSRPEQSVSKSEANPVSSDELKPLYHELKNLFIQRAKLSNTFHDVVTDQDRASISKEIQAIQANIATKMKAISYIKEHGKAPAKLAPVEIPPNDFELFKKKENLRQALSRGRNNLEKLKAAGKDTTRQENFVKKQEEKYEYINRLIKEKGLQ